MGLREAVAKPFSGSESWEPSGNTRQTCDTSGPIIKDKSVWKTDLGDKCGNWKIRKEVTPGLWTPRVTMAGTSE